MFVAERENSKPIRNWVRKFFVKCIRPRYKFFEYCGVAALWLLGIVIVFPSSWPWYVLLILAFVSSLFIILYGLVAIDQRHGGDEHYFGMASMAVVLALVSLLIPAWQLDGLLTLALYFFASSLLVILIFLIRTRRAQHRDVTSDTLEILGNDEISRAGALVDEEGEAELRVTSVELRKPSGVD